MVLAAAVVGGVIFGMLECVGEDGGGAW
jgi:hypothetical protein